MAQYINVNGFQCRNKIIKFFSLKKCTINNLFLLQHIM